MAARSSAHARTRPRTRRCRGALLPLVALLALTALLAGCGSTPDAKLPPAATPASSPAIVGTPAGLTIPLAGGPGSVVIDAGSQTAAVALASPPSIALINMRTHKLLRKLPLPAAAGTLSLLPHAGGDHLAVPLPSSGEVLEFALPSGNELTHLSLPVEPDGALPVAGGDIVVRDEHGSSLTLLHGARTAAYVPTHAEPTSFATLRGGKLLVVVSGLARVVELRDARTLKLIAYTPAGVGPSQVVCAPQGPCFVTDTQGDALLVVRVGADGKTIKLTRRVYVPGAPDGIALDPLGYRLWVLQPARNRATKFPAHGRPHAFLRRGTVQQPGAVAIDSATGQVLISGRSALQLMSAAGS